MFLISEDKIWCDYRPDAWKGNLHFAVTIDTGTQQEMSNNLWLKRQWSSRITTTRKNSLLNEL